MAEFEPNLLPDIDEEEIISPARLLNALYHVANRNRQFKRGQKDGVEFQVSYCERLQPGAFNLTGEDLDVGEEYEDPQLTREITYYSFKFLAQRLRFSNERPLVTFNFRTEERHENVSLPGSIELDEEVAELYDETEPLTRVEKTIFNMRSDYKHLDLFEGVTYENEENDTVVDFNSEEFDSDDEETDREILTHMTEPAELRIATEKGQLVLSRQQLAESEIWLNSQLETNKLNRAYRALQSIERALLEQAGVL